MEFRQIRYAIAICEERSFTRAAIRCGVRQPTITNAIKKLEQELGQRLFVRRQRQGQSELTAFGQQVLPAFYRVQESCNLLDAVVAEGTERIDASDRQSPRDAA
jgi:DNA-binding transcriptional LysR family regulator